MDIPLIEIANQNFQQGSDYLKSIANAARKSFCGVARPIDGSDPADIIVPPPIAALQREFYRSMCELPAEPIPQPVDTRLPSNLGKCECQPYRVSWTVLVGQTVFDSGTVDRWGPISTFNRSANNPNDPTLRQVGLVSGGLITGPCSPGSRDDQFLQSGGSVGPSIRIDAIVPVPGQTFVDCSRPTLPTDRNDRPKPPTLPDIKIPVPNLPDINIPIFPVPLPVLPGVKFEPKLVIDVGGINIEFNAGGVNFSFNPTINAPITLFPPGFRLPSLPPGVGTGTGGGGGVDCCDELKRVIALARGEIEVVRSEVIENQVLTQQVENVQTGTVVPRLGRLILCACKGDVAEVASWADLNAFTYNTGADKLRRALVNINGEPIKSKTWFAQGGQTVSIVGWYAFGRDGKWGTRRQLQYLENICYPDDDEQNDFTFTLQNGLKSNGKVFKIDPPEVNPQP